MNVINIFGIIIILAGVGFLAKIYKRRPWLWNYIKYTTQHKAPQPKPGRPIHIMFSFVDHFEPKEQCSDPAIQKERMRNWYERYPLLASNYRDADGHHPQHTWFYQVEDWEHSNLDKIYLKQLANLVFDGFGEVELHIHHNQPKQGYFPEVDTGEKLKTLINQMKDFFSHTGALVTAEKDPRKTYGFIHGMFALDNSHGGIYCGVNNEFQILRETGCYADFTMPAGVYIAQTKKINSIYYVIDDPQRPRSHDSGVDVKVGQPSVGDLMTIQGPLRVNFFKYPKYWKASVENANVDDAMPPVPSRIDQWINSNIHVKGQPEWVFVKIHTHGSREASFPVYFEEAAERMFWHLLNKYNDGKNYVLHFVTAREAYNIVKAAEAGKTGNPNDYRDFIVKPYANSLIKTNTFYDLKSWSPEGFRIKVLEQNDNARFEFKNQKLRHFSADWLDELEYENQINERALLLTVRGRGHCSFQLEQSSPKEIFVNGKKQTFDKKRPYEILLTSNVTQITITDK